MMKDKYQEFAVDTYRPYEMAIGDIIAVDNDTVVEIDKIEVEYDEYGGDYYYASGINLLSGEHVRECVPYYREAYEVVPQRKEYTLVYIDDDNYCSLMDDNNNTREDLQIPNNDINKPLIDSIYEILTQATHECIVTVVKVIGKERIEHVRLGNPIM